MGKLNNSLISTLQNSTLKQKLQKDIYAIDINFGGYSLYTQTENSLEKQHSTLQSETQYKFLEENGTNSIIIKAGKDANSNRVLAWLVSKPGDYVRNYNQSGILYNFLSTNINDNNLQNLKDLLTVKFNDIFAGDLTLINVNIIPNNNNKTLVITMLVTDNYDKTVFPVNAEVSL